ncbi:hypothetical protein BJY01DRAFT_213508 [Aspergillus pseudoustus]|uniref:C2H2-type domain-containing protein n=1 Tax=Aspergillus pseudoustus TaxID=1810923 RepID=A0ABR4K314_9EURO
MPRQTSAVFDSPTGKGNLEEATLKHALETLMDPLNVAIDTISDQKIRDVFKLLCEISPETRRLATERLLIDKSQKRVVSESGSGSESESGEEDDAEDKNHEDHDPPSSVTAAAPSHLKRQISRYARCENCGKEFDVTTNTSKSCTYHPKDCEPTEEMYVDMYDGDDFEVDSPEMREDFPEHFMFWCCQSTLKDNPEGCKIGWHVAVTESPKKKKRSTWYR